MSLKETLYDNINHTFTSIDTLYAISERLNHKHETASRKLRELTNERRIEKIVNEKKAIIGYRRTKEEVKEPKTFSMLIKQSHLFKLRPIR